MRLRRPELTAIAPKNPKVQAVAGQSGKTSHSGYGSNTRLALV